MARGNEPLGEIATELLFENERVKMWSLIVDPGEKSDWHLHELDYMVINLEADEVTRELEDGTLSTSTPQLGTTTFQDEHSVHRVVNNSNGRYRVVLVELKH